MCFSLSLSLSLSLCLIHSTLYLRIAILAQDAFEQILVTEYSNPPARPAMGDNLVAHPDACPAAFEHEVQELDQDLKDLFNGNSSIQGAFTKPWKIWQTDGLMRPLQGPTQPQI